LILKRREALKESLGSYEAADQAMVVVANLTNGWFPLAALTDERVDGNTYILGTNIQVIQTKIGSSKIENVGFTGYFDDVFSDEEKSKIGRARQVIVVDVSFGSMESPEHSPNKFHYPSAFVGYLCYLMKSKGIAIPQSWEAWFANSLGLLRRQGTEVKFWYPRAWYPVEHSAPLLGEFDGPYEPVPQGYDSSNETGEPRLGTQGQEWIFCHAALPRKTNIDRLHLSGNALQWKRWDDKGKEREGQLVAQRSNGGWKLKTSWRLTNGLRGLWNDFIEGETFKEIFRDDSSFPLQANHAENEIHLLALDLDGTLVTPKKTPLSSQMVEKLVNILWSHADLSLMVVTMQGMEELRKNVIRPLEERMQGWTPEQRDPILNRIGLFPCGSAQGYLWEEESWAKKYDKAEEQEIDFSQLAQVLGESVHNRGASLEAYGSGGRLVEQLKQKPDDQIRAMAEKLEVSEDGWHIVPKGITKAVGRDFMMSKRGIVPGQALAIGNDPSLSLDGDLWMQPLGGCFREVHSPDETLAVLDRFFPAFSEAESVTEKAEAGIIPLLSWAIENFRVFKGLEIELEHQATIEHVTFWGLSALAVLSGGFAGFGILAFVWASFTVGHIPGRKRLLKELGLRAPPWSGIFRIALENFAAVSVAYTLFLISSHWMMIASFGVGFFVLTTWRHHRMNLGYLNQFVVAKTQQPFQDGVRSGEKLRDEVPPREQGQQVDLLHAVLWRVQDFFWKGQGRSQVRRQSVPPQESDHPVLGETKRILRILLKVLDFSQTRFFPSLFILLQEVVNVTFPIVTKISFSSIQGLIVILNEKWVFVNLSTGPDQVSMGKAMSGIVPDNDLPDPVMGNFNLDGKTRNCLPYPGMFMSSSYVGVQGNQVENRFGRGHKGSLTTLPRGVNGLGVVPHLQFFRSHWFVIGFFGVGLFALTMWRHHQMNLEYLRAVVEKNQEASAESRFSTMTSLPSSNLNSSRSTLTLIWFLMMRRSPSILSSFSSTRPIRMRTSPISSVFLATISYRVSNFSLASFLKLVSPSPITLNWPRISSIRTELYRWVSSEVGTGFGDFFSSMMERILKILSKRVNRNVERQELPEVKLQDLTSVIAHMEGLSFKKGESGVWIKRQGFKNGKRIDLTNEERLKEYKRFIHSKGKKESFVLRHGDEKGSQVEAVFDFPGADLGKVELIRQAFQQQMDRMTDAEQGQLLAQVRSREKAGYAGAFVISLLENSRHPFEDHQGNGFIGISKQLFAQNIDNSFLFKLLNLGLRHELRHEMKEKLDEELDAFEKELFDQDVDYARELGIAVRDLISVDLFQGSSALIVALQKQSKTFSRRWFLGGLGVVGVVGVSYWLGFLRPQKKESKIPVAPSSSNSFMNTPALSDQAQALQKLQSIQEGMLESPQKEKAQVLLEKLRTREIQLVVVRGRGGKGVKAPMTMEPLDQKLTVNLDLITEAYRKYALEAFMAHEAFHIDHTPYLKEHKRITEEMGKILGSDRRLQVERLKEDGSLRVLFQRRLALGFWPEILANEQAMEYIALVLRERQNDFQLEYNQDENSRTYFNQILKRGVLDQKQKLNLRRMIWNTIDVYMRGIYIDEWIFALHLESALGHAPPFENERVLKRMLNDNDKVFFLGLLYSGRGLSQEKITHDVGDVIDKGQHPLFQYLFVDPLSREWESKFGVSGPAPSNIANMEGLKLKNEGPMMWWGQGIEGKDIQQIKGQVKAQSKSLGEIAGKAVWIDKEILSRFTAFGFEGSNDFEKFLKEYLAEQFDHSPPQGNEIILSLLSSSTHLFEDHQTNGFIGINGQVFNSRISPACRLKLLKLGLRHELRHESGVGNTIEEEAMLLEEDIEYVLQELKITVEELTMFRTMLQEEGLGFAQRVYQWLRAKELSSEEGKAETVYQLTHLELEGTQSVRWCQETNDDGQLLFSVTVNGVRKQRYLSTSGSKNSGKVWVDVMRFYTREWGWVYRTRREVHENGRRRFIISESRLEWDESHNSWTFKNLDRTVLGRMRREVVAHLSMGKSEAQKSDAVRELGWWKQGTIGNGKLTYGWGKNSALLSTGSIEEGEAEVRRFFDSMRKEWIYETRRRVAEEGVSKTIICQSRLKWEEDKGHWVFEPIEDPIREQIVAHLRMSKTKAQKRKAVEPFEDWEVPTDARGDISFYWVDEQKKEHHVSAATGTKKECPSVAKLSRTFDPEWGWVYKTRRVVAGEEFINFLRMVWNEDKKHLDLKPFDPSEERIVQHVRMGQKGLEKNAVKPFEGPWSLKADKFGRVVVTWTEETGRGELKKKMEKRVVLPTGPGQGPVEIRRFYDDSLAGWIYETRKRFHRKTIFRFHRLVLKGNAIGFQPRLSSGYSNVEQVQVALREREAGGFGNDVWSLLNGMMPNRPLWVAALKWNVTLPSITVLDGEFNGEAEVASMQLPGEKGFLLKTRTRKEVLDELDMLIAGTAKLKTDGRASKNGMRPELQRAMAIALMDLKQKIEEGTATDAVKEFLGLREPTPISRLDIEDAHSGMDRNTENDPFQSHAQDVSLNPKANVILIQGGAGSGKTSTLVGIVQQFVQQGKRVMVVSRTNRAVDHLLARLDKIELPIMRVYNKGVDGGGDERILEKLRKYWVRDRQNFNQYDREGARICEHRWNLNGNGYVVGATIHSMGLVPETYRNDFDVVIVEEAGTVNEAETLLAVAKAREKVVLAGDHRQLQPYFESQWMAGHGKEFLRLMKRSGMGRRWDRGYPQVFLARNYRSHPAITVLVGLLFYRRLMVPKYWRMMERDTLRMVDVPMEGNHPNEEKEGKSYKNLKEAEQALREYQRALLSGYRPEQITILTGYAAQVDLIRDLLKSYLTQKRDMNPDRAEGLVREQVSTVDSYQGRENHVVIYSFVRSNSAGEVGHIRNLNRLNVALSRSIDRLVVMGDRETLMGVKSSQSKKKFTLFFHGLRKWMREMKQLYQNQNHDFYTLREAIQAKNQARGRKRLMEDVEGVSLIPQSIQRLEDYLIGRNVEARQIMTEKEYAFLEDLHEKALQEQRRMKLAQEDYENEIQELIQLSEKYPDLIAYDADKNICELKWLMEEGRPVQLGWEEWVATVLGRDVVKERLDPKRGVDEYARRLLLNQLRLLMGQTNELDRDEAFEKALDRVVRLITRENVRVGALRQAVLKLIGAMEKGEKVDQEGRRQAKSAIFRDLLQLAGAVRGLDLKDQELEKIANFIMNGKGELPRHIPQYEGFSDYTESLYLDDLLAAMWEDPSTESVIPRVTRDLVLTSRSSRIHIVNANLDEEFLSYLLTALESWEGQNPATLDLNLPEEPGSSERAHVIARVRMINPSTHEVEVVCSSLWVEMGRVYKTQHREQISHLPAHQVSIMDQDIVGISVTDQGQMHVDPTALNQYLNDLREAGKEEDFKGLIPVFVNENVKESDEVLEKSARQALSLSPNLKNVQVFVIREGKTRLSPQNYLQMIQTEAKKRFGQEMTGQSLEEIWFVSSSLKERLGDELNSVMAWVVEGRLDQAKLAVILDILAQHGQKISDDLRSIDPPAMDEMNQKRHLQLRSTKRLASLKAMMDLTQTQM
ncbi:MAG: AAA family ATPase, partial [Chlamydiae bacterium]|nr:AAA family ATPase [Chlamydiota bacterium]